MHTTDVPSPAETELDPNDALRAEIAARIRKDSEHRGALTAGHGLADLFADMSPEEAEPVLVDLLNDEQYGDIKALDTSGDLYFYSDRFLEPPTAEEMILGEEVMFRIAATVRQESKESAKLTPVASLSAILTELDVKDVQPFLTTLVADERYQDMQLVTLPNGDMYLYSQQHISGTYAKLLARTEVGDPWATIAETVREESQTYPRPTDVRLFAEPPFNMKRDDIPDHVEGLLAEPAYSDIKKIVASTGTVYLYSETHLGVGLAKSMVEWEEVGRHENP